MVCASPFGIGMNASELIVDKVVCVDADITLSEFRDNDHGILCALHCSSGLVQLELGLR